MQPMAQAMGLMEERHPAPAGRKKRKNGDGWKGAYVEERRFSAALRRMNQGL